MKLLSLYASNFKCLDFDQPLRFHDGITVISGLNEAGKSTILDAMLYALYGKVTRPPGHVKDEDLLAYTTSRATIILEFTIGEQCYRATREIRRNGVNKASLDQRLDESHWKPVATKSRDVTSTIISLLGDISFDEMISSNVVAQKDLDRLVEQGNGRWKVINAFLHLESFNRAIESLNDEKIELEGTGQNRPGVIRSERDKLEQLERDFEEYKRREAQSASKLRENDELKGQIEKLTPQYGQLKDLQEALSEYNEAESELHIALTEAEGKEKLLESHRSTVQTFEGKIAESQTEVGKYEDLPSEASVERLERLAQEFRDSDSGVGRIKRELDAKRVEVDAAEKELGGVDRTKMQSARSSKVSLRPYTLGAVGSIALAIVSFLLSIPVLPLAAGAVGIVLIALLAVNISRMNQLVKMEGTLGKLELLDGKRKEMTVLEDSLKSTVHNSNEEKAALQNAADGFSRYRQLQAGQEPLTRTSAIVAQFRIESKNKGIAQSSVKQLTEGLNAVKSRVHEDALARLVADLKAKAKSIVMPSLPAGVVFSKSSLDTVMRQREEIGNSIVSKRATIESNTRSVKEDEIYLHDNAGISGELEGQRKLVDGFIRRLKVVKAAKLGVERTAEARRTRFHPGVESYMGQILPSLTSGRYKAVMLDDDFALQVWDPEAGEFRPKDVFSGGTEDQCLLAMRLAFALALMPEVKGTTPEFLWLDEPLGSSDEIRRSGIVEYINASLCKLFPQVFIVSHVGGLEEQIPNVIRLDSGKVVS